VLVVTLLVGWIGGGGLSQPASASLSYATHAQIVALQKEINILTSKNHGTNATDNIIKSNVAAIQANIKVLQTSVAVVNIRLGSDVVIGGIAGTVNAIQAEVISLQNQPNPTAATIQRFSAAESAILCIENDVANSNLNSVRFCGV
jgi:hypothetical protein